MKNFLVRADDLGYSEGTNYGILKSVRDGIIKNVGLMPNMEYAAHGVEFLKNYDICMGQHTNICAGRPLTPPARIPSIVQANGEFRTSSEYRNASEDFVVLDEVILEIEAQYERFRELTGMEPRYFEGHAVNSANFYEGLRIVAERHGLRYLKINFEGDAIPFGQSKLYMRMESMSPGYNPFDSLKRAALEDLGSDGCAMMICHPGFLDAYILKSSSLTTPRPMETEMLTSFETKKWLRENDIRLVTFDELYGIE